MKLKYLFLLAFMTSLNYGYSQCCTVDGWGIENVNNNLVSFDGATGDLTVIAPLSGDLSGSVFQAGGEVIDCQYYAAAGTNIYAVNTTDGTSTLAVANGAMGSETYTGLEVDPSTGIFYASSTNITQSSLWQINLAAGTATLVGTAPGTCAISVVIDMNGNAYYIDICSDDIYPISLATGQPTGPGMPLGFDLNFGQDYSFDCPAGTNTVYGYAFNNTTFSMQYITVDPPTGTVNVIQDFAGDPAGILQIASMAFCISEEVEIVPTLGEWAIISLGLLMMIFGVVAVGQRKTAIA